jgi:hypothetical protein
MRLSSTGLARLSVTLCQVSVVVDDSRRLLLLQSQFRLLQRLARSLEVSSGGLLRQRIL